MGLCHEILGYGENGCSWQCSNGCHQSFHAECGHGRRCNDLGGLGDGRRGCDACSGLDGVGNTEGMFHGAYLSNERVSPVWGIS